MMLREWLSQQNPDDLEQFLNWFNFSTERNREILGRQELAKLRAPAVKPAEVVTLKPGIWGMSFDLKALWRRFVAHIRALTA
jgi:hypothetical protein